MVRDEANYRNQSCTTLSARTGFALVNPRAQCIPRLAGLTGPIRDTFSTTNLASRTRFALVGNPTWREPNGGGTSHLRAIPADHMVAPTVSFGRRNPTSAGHRHRHGQWHCLPLRPHVCGAGQGHAGATRSTFVRRHRQHVGHFAMAAYSLLLGSCVPRCPPTAGRNRTGVT